MHILFRYNEKYLQANYVILGTYRKASVSILRNEESSLCESYLTTMSHSTEKPYLTLIKLQKMSFFYQLEKKMTGKCSALVAKLHKTFERR